MLAVALLLLVAAATRGPRLHSVLERPAAWTLRHGSQLLRRPAADPALAIRAWAERLGSFRLSPSGWMTVTGLALANWLADAAVLAVSIHAAGAAVPWHDLLLAYGSGIAAQSLNVTPGGLGITEGTLSVALVATGLHASQALAAVLLYRLASFWLVASAGWLVLLWLRHRQPARPDTAPRERRHLPYAVRRGRDRRRYQNAHRPASGPLPAPEINPPGTRRRARHVMTADTEVTALRGHAGSRTGWFGRQPGAAPGRGGGSARQRRPGCVNRWDRLLAAPGAGPLSALAAWQLTLWIARARLARTERRRAARCSRTSTSTGRFAATPTPARPARRAGPGRDRVPGWAPAGAGY